ncbi:MAG TPA: pyridoxamine 5'-phosphate oxidase family protein [Candidatus Methylomirabilis sp.]|nr:pyridoxamine 5'-phosphate oxidase family protein [Candidatus Methylomirabilis sp.]
MGKQHDAIDERLEVFLRSQRVFFVATAPLAAEGHINCSPKGLDTFAILGPRAVAYLDLTGSGVETIAHLRENGRIVLTFCAFEGAPKIVRLHGRGEVVEPGDPAFAALRERFPAHHEGVRSAIRVAVERIADSCGYGVPEYRYVADRSQLPQWAKRKGAGGTARYRAEHNLASIDGLPGVRS